VNQGAAASKRPWPRAAIYFAVLVLFFTLLPTIQTIVVGFLLGFDSDLFIVRLWSVGFLWLAPVTILLVMAPMLAPMNRRLLQRVRAACIPITVAALGLIVWSAAFGNMPGVMLAIGVMITLITWVGTFVVERLSVNRASQPEA